MSDNVSLLEARQRGLLSALPRAVFETDDKFNWIDANLAMERLTGKGWANLELRRWVASIHEEDRPDVMMELHNAVEDKRGVNISFRFRTDSGVIPVSMDAIPIFSRVKPNTVICWSGSMKTDDDQRMAERRRI
jgi:PAS domain S-box-containing protein